MSNGWIGVDLDGTLAEYGKLVAITVIGKPIPLMVDRVKNWIQEGKTVKIFTARADDSAKCALDGSPYDVQEVIELIQDWCEKHIGVRLEVTNKKDYLMLEIWDDRAIQVEMNTGRRIDGKQ